MRYTLTILEKDIQTLRSHLFSHREVEQAAYLLCGISASSEEMRLLVRHVIPVDSDDIEEQSAVHMKIKAPSFRRAMKTADDDRACFVFVHTHTNGLLAHSPQDHHENTELFRTAYIRIKGTRIHASLVFTSPEQWVGLVWLEDGSVQALELTRVIGKRFSFTFHGPYAQVNLNYFDRQVRAFGEETQALLQQLRVGVVGAGGTGSAVTEQLVRLGVGSLFLADRDFFDVSNINRVYGSRTIDGGIAKVRLLQRLATDIGLGTNIEFAEDNITKRNTLLRLRDCDIVFGCTDDEWGRSILTRLAIYYYIPVFDLGVKIDSSEGRISSIQGRVTTLLPGEACLFCRRRLSPDRIRAETILSQSPDAFEQLRREGYVPELDTRAPAVIPFTSTVASTATTELLHRLTGFLGDDRESSEVLHLFDLTRIGRNRRPPVEDCFCVNVKYWGRGDTKNTLDLIWPEN